MGVQINRLINQPELAADAYLQKAKEVTKANKEIAASGKEVADSMTATDQAAKRTDQALSGRATGIEALQRKYDAAYRAQKEFEKAQTSITKQIEAGNVRMLKAGWNAEFIDELKAFPSGRHDDMVDALSRAYMLLTERAVRPAASPLRQPVRSAGGWAAHT